MADEWIEEMGGERGRERERKGGWSVSLQFIVSSERVCRLQKRNFFLSVRKREIEREEERDRERGKVWRGENVGGILFDSRDESLGHKNMW